MARIDHVAFETDDPDGVARFYERILDAKVVKAEGHPVMAYMGNTGVALHEPGGPGPHTAVRVTEDERREIGKRLAAEGVESEERDHGVGVGLFFRDPDGRTVEAITYRGGDDPRREQAS
ncbi:MAG TPA: VOC family protein [Gaiellaceae bacterium]|jgi:catechol 2,3-dioxygenase-like lactoylglutathione lyase family enzyme|nr:VOC family protein [Gaiellaceae bacterium]